MSLCNNYILSILFAWWGCYLNKNYNYEVIAPLCFFREKNKKELEKVYYFKDWIIMDE